MVVKLGNLYKNIRLYREWQFRRNAVTRTLQRADLPNEFLEEDASNLGLILNSLRRNPEIKRKLLESLKLFYKNVDNFDVIVQGGYIQVFFEENGFTIPASRLSDGTLRYFSLLAILLHPNPPLLANYYGKDFNKNALSQNANIENISKQDLYNSLDRATRDTTKGKYSDSKGGHSFDILGKINANKVIAHSSYAKKLRDTLYQLLNIPIPSS